MQTHPGPSGGPRTFVAVGAGQAAASAARTLRRQGYDGRIVLVGDEPHAPYQRPPLSKEYLADGPAGTELALLSGRWCEENAVELRLGTPAVRIDRAAGAVELADGERIAGDRFLLATGARPRRLPGVEGERIIHLRRIEDAERLRGFLRPGARIAVIGAGFIGSELASAVLDAGGQPVVVERAEAPLERQLGRRFGGVCAEIQRAAGVELHTGEALSSVRETGRGVLVTTDSGLCVEADALVVAVGAVPDTALAEASGLDVGDGVLVDERLRTSDPRIWAAGDAAAQWHPLYGRRIRTEHVDNADRQGATVARNVLGGAVVHDDPLWSWSDQFGLNLQHCGHAERWDRIVVRGSVEERDFVAFYLDEGRLRAAFGMERGGEVLAAKELIALGARPDPAALADEDVELDELAGPEVPVVFPVPPGGREAGPPAGGPADGPAGGPADEPAGGPADGPAEGPADAPEREYVRVARSGQVPEGVVRRFHVGELELAVTRYGGRAYASSNYCTHLDCLLSSGRPTREGLLCSCHGSVFDYATGEPLSPPARLPIRVFPVREVDGEILVGLIPGEPLPGPRSRRGAAAPR